MAQRLHNLSKWERFEGSLVFENPEPRMVKIDVNCPLETEFYVEREQDAVLFDPERKADALGRRDMKPLVTRTFLGLARGRDQFEFYVEGAFTLHASEECWFFTIDSVRIATEIIAPVIFTRVANRRQRNPHLEMMEFQMNRNLTRRLEAMQAETDRRIEAITAGVERHAPQRDIQAPPSRVGREEQRQDDGAGSAAPLDGDGGPDGSEAGAGVKTAAKPSKAAAADNDGGKKGKAS